MTPNRWHLDNIALTLATAVYPGWLGYTGKAIVWAAIAGLFTGVIWAATTREATHHLPLLAHVMFSILVMMIVAIMGYGVGWICS